MLPYNDYKLMSYGHAHVHDMMQWAYGITCWETSVEAKCLTLASTPQQLILTLLQNGDRLEAPNNAACDKEM